jgi:mannose-6-phosphate isomerase-like protein (cupin superfamily)
VADLTPDELLAWVDGYEREWRAQRADRLGELFTADAVYLTEPYASPVEGLDAIRQLWTEEQDPGEVFMFDRAVVACSGRTGVLRARVRYGDPVTQEYLDLWVVELDESGRAARFEEWPFWPAHGRSPLRPSPLVVAVGEVSATPYAEVVRSWALSAGVYRLAAGADDLQSPHTEDEVYVVTSGSAQLEIDGKRSPVGPGTIAYVPRRVPHRFVDITDDLEVAVLFAPPEGSS